MTEQARPAPARPERITQEQAAILTAYTGILCGDVAEFHRYAEKIMQRPVYTHELADKVVWAALKERSQADFERVAALPKEEPAR